jgi:hypothetical protein
MHAGIHYIIYYTYITGLEVHSLPVKILQINGISLYMQLIDWQATKIGGLPKPPRRYFNIF